MGPTCAAAAAAAAAWGEGIGGRHWDHRAHDQHMVARDAPVVRGGGGLLRAGEAYQQLVDLPGRQSSSIIRDTVHRFIQ